MAIFGLVCEREILAGHYKEDGKNREISTVRAFDALGRR